MFLQSRLLLIAVLGLSLAGCPAPRRPPAPAPAEQAVEPPRGASTYQVAPGDSLVRIIVYRAGALAAAGHHHVIASRALAGRVYLHEERARTAFDLQLPVETFTVDEPQLRRLEGDEFPPEVPERARAGTRGNLLGPAVLDGARYPLIRLRSAAVQPAGEVYQVRTRVDFKGEWRELTVPMRVETHKTALQAEGEFVLPHAALGLEPFSALLGALKVGEEMTVKFRITARKVP